MLAPSMSPRVRSAFVPHDITAPIAGAASGPLAGLTAAVKDMYDIEGYRTGGGSPDWLAQQTPAKTSCPAVRKILTAGATVIGKTVCDEFFYSIAGANAHYGTPVNPRTPGRLPGGSSSGSASATASGACDFALGSDTGGSVRVPASFCGLYGIRPTHGRIDLDGAMAMSPSFDVAGWFASGPGVFRKLGPVLLDNARVEAPIKSAIILDDAFAEAEAGVVKLLNAALSVMSAELPKPSHDRAAPDGLDAWRETFRILQAHEIWAVYGDFVTRQKPSFGPGVRERMQFAATVTADDAAKVQPVRERGRERLRSFAAPGTILILPTAPSVAPAADASAEATENFRQRTMRLTSISGFSGLPQVTIPIGTVTGCPAGLSFIGWAGGDEALLDLAVRLSRYCGIEA